MTLSKTAAEASRCASAWEWAQAALLLINVVWTALCLGGFLAETMVVSSALCGALLTVHLLERAPRRRWNGGDSSVDPPRSHPAGWLLLPFLIYAAGNVLWVTPVPWLGWYDWLAWAQMTAVFWVVLNGVRAKGPRSVLFIGAVILGCVLVLLAGYQRFVAPDWLVLGRAQATQFHGRASGSFGSPNSLAAYLLLFLPALGALAIRRGATATERLLWAYLTVVFALGLVLTLSRGAWLALGLVLVVCPLIAVRGSRLRKWAWLAGSWLCLGMLAVAVYATWPGVQERIDTLVTQRGELSRPIMWHAAWNNFHAAPLLGGGAGSYGARFDQHRPENFQLEARWAHSDYLNVLSDYGLAGFGLLFGAWSAVVVVCSRRTTLAPTNWLDHSAVKAGFGAGLAAFSIQLGVDFSLKIPALAMLFSVVAAMFVQRAWPALAAVTKSPIRRASRAFPFLMAIGVGATTLLLVVPFYRGEAKRQHARQMMDGMAPGRNELKAELLKSARDELIAATKLSPSNGQAWADLAYVMTVLARFNPPQAKVLGHEAQLAADRALAISPVVAEFWLRKGVALDLQGRWTEAGKAFIEALKRAPTRAGVWYHHAFHLSLNPTERGRALAAAQFALRLDPGNPEAHALRQRLAESSHAP